MRRALLALIVALTTLALASGPPTTVVHVAGAQDPGPQRDLRSQRVDFSVMAGLQWLADHQSEDGSWSPTGFAAAGKARGRIGNYGNLDGSSDTGWESSTVGLTALALNAFLTAGYTHTLTVATP